MNMERILVLRNLKVFSELFLQSIKSMPIKMTEYTTVNYLGHFESEFVSCDGRE